MIYLKPTHPLTYEPVKIDVRNTRKGVLLVLTDYELKRRHENEGPKRSFFRHSATLRR